MEKVFNEFELLTLRECLFKNRENKELLNKKEFKQIDNKIKTLLKDFEVV